MKTSITTPALDTAPGAAKSGSPTALFRKWFERSKGPVATRISAVFADLAHYAENGSSGLFKTMYEPPFERRSLAFTTECLQRREVEVNWTKLRKAAEMPGHIFLARQIMVLLDGAIGQSLRNRDGS